ncbi:MAG TPA: translation elongation factor 4 [Coprothermobacter proteolyticus]|uniref:Elongation factor 4 n=1 Tax=Coprothermobacter proteolyticus (strain ATCC 35245 / DSM 5265 / OCM 4 / BT) TaxID=309798 RepID=B5Y9P3_COPPD|nr:translation elongation factor 4 [Coprothermobacter proteolyticus]MBP8983563.1 translation elongation factor 4 [Coprothermobacter sp.]ACI17499.1 GTP-binding protein LepA [Coprothermobacter proteolyticus DSM 5265]NLT83414.1 elongation factor 4 [Coprothermobacter proteolyticus]HOA64570.1 translation elongation factor 4 [Coprothermobacter proteolyticus]HOK24282.1 translation elongation factor 4 [Coprothermobacter proteolyticus]
MADRSKIRNFSIIAHIDHGKSTLADRFLELSGLVRRDKLQKQMLDSMDLERERGITIKSHPVRLHIGDYVFNLIDTPGHVDFSYEVSRSLAACEGAILLVDATQGVEAQTVAHAYKAMEHNLAIVPVINKIDLPSADVEGTKRAMSQLLGKDDIDPVLVSAKEGIGIEELIDRLVKEIPAPNGDENAPLQALVFDSFYDTYKGVVSVVRIFNGQVRVGDRIRFWASGLESEVTEVGVFSLKMVPTESLEAGDVGYVAANIRDIREVPVGDTMTSAVRPADAPIPGFSAMKPMVFASIYPTENEDFERLRESLKKLQLNDAALVFEPESSEAFGPGFRCGFLGLLHMDIIRERLEREFDLDLILTSPNVEYHVLTRSGEYIEVRNPSQFPDFSEVELVEEPYVRGTVVVPSEYVGSVIQLCEGRRGKMLHMEYISQQRVLLEYDLPFAEIITDFYDQLKSVTRGYASFDYEHIGFKEADVDKIEVFINGKKLDALTLLAPKSEVLRVARQVASNLKHTIPKQLVEVVIQVKAGGRIVARETIKPLRKDVLAKCYGGDVSRKKKLLEKQKAGKKRMRQFNQVDIPQEAFLSVLKADTE